MKLGLNPIPTLDWRQMDWQASAMRWKKMGFSSATVFIHKPLESKPADVLPIKLAFDAARLEVNQANGWYECLINPDSSQRAEGIRGMQALCRYGIALQAHAVYMRPGSLNPNGHWWAHPDNTSPATFDRLVESVRKICRTAETEGIHVAIEGHVQTTLNTPQRVRDLLDAVGSPSLKFNLDPVNFMGSLQDVFNTQRNINLLFDLMGKDTIAAHAKDCGIAEAYVLQIHEVLLGTGTMDYNLFLRRFMETGPERDFIIEHLPEEKLPQARENLRLSAEKLGITFC